MKRKYFNKNALLRVVFSLFILTLTISTYCYASPGFQYRLGGYKKYIYRIKINSKTYQTGFRVKGYAGIFTATHGFANSAPPDSNFKRYVINEIMDGHQSFVYKEGTSNKAPFVSKIDIDKDLLFISVPGFSKSEGLEILDPFSYKSISTKAALVIGFPLGSNKLADNYHLLMMDDTTISFSTFESLKLNIAWSRSNIPSWNTNIIVYYNELYHGLSGSPIFDTILCKVVAMVNSSMEKTNMGFGIPLRLTNLKRFTELKHSDTVRLGNRYRYAQSSELNQDINEKVDLTMEKLNNSERSKTATTMNEKGCDSSYTNIDDPENFDYVRQLPNVYKTFMCSKKGKIMEQYHQYFVKSDKKTKQQTKQTNNKFIFSTAFVNTLYHYYEYLRGNLTMNDERALLVENIKSFDSLFKEIKGNSKIITRQERKAWQKAGFNIINETESFLKKITGELSSRSMISLANTYFDSHDTTNAIGTLIRLLGLINEDELFSDNLEKAIGDLSNILKKQKNKHDVAGSNADSLFATNKKGKALAYYTEKLSTQQGGNVDTNTYRYLESIKSSAKAEIKIISLKKVLSNQFIELYNKYSSVQRICEFREVTSGDNNKISLEINFGMQNSNYLINTCYSNYQPALYVNEGIKTITKVIVEYLNYIRKYYSEVIDTTKIKLNVKGYSDAILYNKPFYYSRRDFPNCDFENEIICKNCQPFNKFILGSSNERNLALAYLRGKYFICDIEQKHPLNLLIDQSFQVYDVVGGDFRKVEIEIVLPFKSNH